MAAGEVSASAAGWVSVRITGASRRDAVVDALFAAGSTGIQEDGRDIITHFPDQAGIAGLVGALSALDPVATVLITDAPAADWSVWRASVRSHRLGRLTVTPPWLTSGLDPANTVVIEPQMAFGTGEHATTRGVIRLMQQLPAISGVVADLGAGSAVLAIAAAKLGATRVAAVELDHDAIANAEENVSFNRCEDIVSVIEGDADIVLPLLAPVHLVLANIISSVLLEMLPTISAAVSERGHAILSGILSDERPAILAALHAQQWTVLGEDSEDGWWSVLVQHK